MRMTRTAEFSEHRCWASCHDCRLSFWSAGSWATLCALVAATALACAAPEPTLSGEGSADESGVVASSDGGPTVGTKRVVARQADDWFVPVSVGAWVAREPFRNRLDISDLVQNQPDVSEASDDAIELPFTCDETCEGAPCGDYGCAGDLTGCPGDAKCDSCVCVVVGKPCVDGNDIAWDGCTNGLSSEYMINDSPVGDQILGVAPGIPPFGPTVAQMPDHRLIFVWSGNAGNSDGFDVFCRIFDPAIPGFGASFRVNSFVPGEQEGAQVAALPSGEFIVVWNSRPSYPTLVGQDGYGFGVFGQWYGANGLAQGEEFQINKCGTGDQYLEEIAVLNNSSVLVLWRDDSPDFDDATGSCFEVAPTSLVGKILETPGEEKEGTAAFLLHAPNAGLRDNGDVVVFQDVGFAAGWRSAAPDYTFSAPADFVVGMFALDGTPLAPPKVLVTSNMHSLVIARLFSISEDEFGALWFPAYNQSGCPKWTSISMVEFVEIGTSLANSVMEGGPAFQVHPCHPEGWYSGRHASVACLSNGLCMAIWSGPLSYPGGDCLEEGVFARLLLPDGTFIGSPFLVSAYKKGTSSSYSVTSLDNQSFVVVWENYPCVSYCDSQDGDGSGVFARRFTSGGIEIPLL